MGSKFLAWNMGDTTKNFISKFFQINLGRLHFEKGQATWEAYSSKKINIDNNLRDVGYLKKSGNFFFVLLKQNNLGFRGEKQKENWQTLILFNLCLIFDSCINIEFFVYFRDRKMHIFKKHKNAHTKNFLKNTSLHL